VAANLEVALVQDSLPENGQPDAEQHGGDRYQRARAIEPHEGHARHDELGGGPHELTDERGEAAESGRGVRALGHVGREPAVKVPIGDAGDLPKELHAEPNLEVPSQTKKRARERHVDEHHGERKNDEQAERAQALRHDPEPMAEVERGAKQKPLSEDRERSHEDGAPRRGEAGEPHGSQHGEEGVKG
jgi:hypothetical protein